MVKETAPADWQIGKLYEKAWEIIKKNKVLWIFGAAIAGIGSSYSSSNFQSDDFKFFEKIFQQDSVPTNPGQLTQVLGATTDSSFGQILTQLTANIPSYFYFLLSIEVLAVVGVMLFFGILKSAWTTGGLISGTYLASEGKSVTIRDSSEKTFPHLRSLIWLQIVPSLVVFGGAVLAFGILTLVITLGPTPLKIIFGLLAVVGFIALLYILVFLFFSQIWAPRKVIIDQDPAKKALFSSYKIAKKKFWAMALLALVNSILGFIVVMVPLMLIGVIFALGFLGFRGNFNPVVILPLLPIIPVFIFGFLLLSGILTAFKATVWTLAYQKIRGKYDQDK